MKPEFNATYSDWKLIKTRRVVQIVLEVPLEASGRAYEVLGGMPRPDAEIWCGVARLSPGKEVVQAERSGPEERMGNPSSPGRDTQPRQIAVQPSGGAQRRDWADLTPAQQAGIICGERPFWRYLYEQSTYRPECAEDAAEAVRAICGVSSRRDIGENHHARLIWVSLVDAYRAWGKKHRSVCHDW